MRPNPTIRRPRGDESGSERGDEQLVRDVLEGDRGAFEILVRRHHRALVSHLFRLTGRRDGATDLAQEVFLKVYVALPSFNPKYRFTTWLYRIASNCAIDQLRRKQPRTCSLTPGTGEETRREPAEVLVGSEPTPDEALRLRELQARVELAIRDLPPEHRQLILLRHRQHCRYDEIARITCLPIGTVKNRIFRARAMLRESLSDVLSNEVQHGEV